MAEKSQVSKEQRGMYLISPMREPVTPVPFDTTPTDLNPATDCNHCHVCLNLVIDCLCEKSE